MLNTVAITADQNPTDFVDGEMSLTIAIFLQDFVVIACFGAVYSHLA